MTKNEFLAELRRLLADVPPKELDSSIDYYAEMIDDRMDDGMTEEEAVCAMGTPEEAAKQVLSEIPLASLLKNRIKPRRTVRTWEIVLLILGSPIWLSLLAAAFAVFLALYVVFWSVIIVLYAASVTIGAGALVGIFYPIYYFVLGNVGAGLFILGAGLFLLGLTFFAFWGSLRTTKGFCILHRTVFRKIKSRFVRKDQKR